MTDPKIKPEIKFKFDKIDIPTFNIKKMLHFYKEIFGINFLEINEKINDKDWKLYLGHLGDVKFFLCPGETSGTKPDQEGIHQFHLKVSDLKKFIYSIKDKGYKIDKVPFGDGTINYCIRDPDGNPWILSN